MYVWFTWYDGGKEREYVHVCVYIRVCGVHCEAVLASWLVQGSGEEEEGEGEEEDTEASTQQAERG